ARRGLADAELVAEAMAAAGALEAVDALVAVVVVQHDRDLATLLHRGDDLVVQHQVAAVADEGVHLALRPRHLHPEGARDLVAHAGVAVLRVVVSARLAPPELVEVAGQAAGGVDHGAVLVDAPVEDAYHLGLLEDTSVTTGMEDLAVDPVPLLAGGADLALVAFGGAVIGERLAYGLYKSP